VGLKTLANPQQTRVGKNRGVEGAKPPPKGQWGMCPHKTLKGEAANPFKPATEWDSRRWQTLSKRGWEKPGVEGATPPPRGPWGMCPQNKNKG